MTFLQETELERALRRITSCTHTLYAVADDMTDHDDPDDRADLVIAAENLLEISLHVTEMARGVAWQYSPLPESNEEEDDY